MNELFENFYKNLFLEKRLFACLSLVILLFVLSFFFSWLGVIPVIALVVVVLLFGSDLFLLYRIQGISASRTVADRLSNGDENKISILIENLFRFPIKVGIIDEIPFQFQKRDVWFKVQLGSSEIKSIDYFLKPLKRGEYDFGNLHVYVKSPLSLISRRFTFGQKKTVAVYPSFQQMRRFELIAISNRLTDVGIKKVRRTGHSMEFDQIKNYVSGDDHRTVNWKASARRGELMVNSYTDEKSQQVYCIIDKSRAMKMPFEGLSLLDYAINASLALSNVAMLKDDKAGLITISDTIGKIVPADRKPGQLNKILETLYKEKTRYLELNSEALYAVIRQVLKQRSLVVFFTNFESIHSMERQLPVLKKIAGLHLLLVVFFENTETKKIYLEAAKDIESIYIKTIAEKFAYEKRQIVLELAKHGIQSILSSPQNLSVDTINRYIQIKSKQGI